MDQMNLPKQSTGCGCSRPQEAKKTALDSKREELINRIRMRRQKENPVYKTRNKLFL
jgi:hypothetical protein